MLNFAKSIAQNVMKNTIIFCVKNSVKLELANQTIPITVTNYSSDSNLRNLAFNVASKSVCSDVVLHTPIFCPIISEQD